ncbi:MAG: DUF507 family protein [Bdellovibrionales bacterium]|nr:DUF507 family protein [Bdellovibrionales bacterium]
MKMTKIQIERMVRRVFDELKSNAVVTFKENEEKVYLRAMDLVAADYERERQLERDAQKMLDDIERQNPGPLDRHKMFLMIKKKLAQERKVVL